MRGARIGPVETLARGAARNPNRLAALVAHLVKADALRERARRMLEDGAAPADLPPCPPGTADPAAAGCLPR